MQMQKKVSVALTFSLDVNNLVVGGNIYCIHGHAGLWLNVTVGQQCPLTAGAQDVLRSW